MNMNFDNLKRVGLKVTTPRVLILQLFENSHTRHLSAEDIHRRLMTEGHHMSVATIYRVLSQFEQAGILMRHFFDNGRAYFELNNLEHHDHIICIDCGHVQEFFDEEIEKGQQAAAEKYGFDIFSHALYIYGKCNKPHCIKKESVKSNAKDESNQKLDENFS